MKIIYILMVGSLLAITSCGKGSGKNKPEVDTTSIDTASVDQLEQELKDLEEQSSKVNHKIDSVDNLLNE